MNCPGIFLRQKIELLEILAGCGTINKYFIYQKKKEKYSSSGRKYWKVRDKTHCINRNCISTDCRPIEIKVKNINGNEDYHDPTSLVIVKNCSWTCLCFNRTKVDVIFTEEERDIYLGSISYDFDFVDASFTVYD